MNATCDFFKFLGIVFLLYCSGLSAWGEEEAVRVSAESLTDAAIARRTWDDSKYKYSVDIYQAGTSSICCIEFCSNHHYGNLYLCDEFLVFDNNRDETHPACLVIERNTGKAHEFSVDEKVDRSQLGSSIHVCLADPDGGPFTCKTNLWWHKQSWVADCSTFYILGESVIFRYSLQEGGIFMTRRKEPFPFSTNAVDLHIKHKEFPGVTGVCRDGKQQRK